MQKLLGFVLAFAAVTPVLAQDDDEEASGAAVPCAWKLEGGAKLRVEWTIERTWSDKVVGGAEEKQSERRKVVMDWIAPPEGIDGKGELKVELVRVEWSIEDHGLRGQFVFADGEFSERKLEREGGEATDAEIDGMVAREDLLGLRYKVVLGPAKGSIGIQPRFEAELVGEDGTATPFEGAGLFAPLGEMPGAAPYLHPPLPPGGVKKGQKLDDERFAAFMEPPGVTRADAEGIAIAHLAKSISKGGGGGSGSDGPFNFDLERLNTAELSVELAKGRLVSVKLVEVQKHHETPAKKDPGSAKEKLEVTRAEQTWTFAAP